MNATLSEKWKCFWVLCCKKKNVNQVKQTGKKVYMLHNCLAKINRMDLNSLKRNQNDIVEVTILYAASVEFFAMF